MEMFNRRQYDRSALGVPAQLMVEKGDAIAVAALDISPSGMALRVPAPVSVGERCVVAVDLPIADRRRRFNAWGVAVYCRREEGHYRLGIAFVDVNSRSMATLQQLQNAWHSLNAANASR